MPGLPDPTAGQICLTGARSAGCYGATWIWPPWLRSQATWVHEMGHALGLEHTARDAGHQYGNLWDAMSENGACGIDSEYGPLAQHLIAYHKDLLGWIPASAKLLLAAPGETTFKLAPLAQPAADNSYLLAQIPIDGSDRHFYTLEARTRTGYDRHLPSDAVIIHEVDLRMPRLLRAYPPTCAGRAHSGTTLRQPSSMTAGESRWRSSGRMRTASPSPCEPPLPKSRRRPRRQTWRRQTWRRQSCPIVVGGNRAGPPDPGGRLWCASLA